MRARQFARVAVVGYVVLAPVLGFCDMGQISREQIFSALKAGFVGTPFDNLEFAAEQVKLPGIVFARAHAQIRLVQLSVDRQTHVIDARLRCEKSGCMPFYVSIVDVHLPAEVKTKGTFRRSEFAPAQIDGGVGKVAVMVVRQGEMASLSIQKSELHISVPAICLQPGALGQVIRTRIVGTNRITAAQVRGPGHLSGVTAPGGQ
jgi:hypothetical protein